MRTDLQHCVMIAPCSDPGSPHDPAQGGSPSLLLAPWLCRFKKQAKKIPGKGGQRYWKNVGLGFKTPKEAIEGMAPSTGCGC